MALLIMLLTSPVTCVNTCRRPKNNLPNAKIQGVSLNSMLYITISKACKLSGEVMLTPNLVLDIEISTCISCIVVLSMQDTNTSLTLLDIPKNRVMFKHIAWSLHCWHSTWKTKHPLSMGSHDGESSIMSLCMLFCT